MKYNNQDPDFQHPCLTQKYIDLIIVTEKDYWRDIFEIDKDQSLSMTAAAAATTTQW